VSQRIEWQHAVPGPVIPLGRYGKVPGEIVLAPFTVLAWTHGESRTGAAVPGVVPSIGVGAIGLFNMLRVDVAHAMRGGAWMFSVDVTRDFWRIL
jgi:hypothetical protein